MMDAKDPHNRGDEDLKTRLRCTLPHAGSPPYRLRGPSVLRSSL